MTCSIDGCDKPIEGRGWCSAHYNRWKRHGDPMKRVKLRGEAIKFFNEVVLTYEGDDCLEWPFTTNGKGYGWVAINGKGKSVPTAVCEAVYGPRPADKQLVAHSCGKGHLRCCAKRHLRWATYKENTADMAIHGTLPIGEKQGGSKLKTAQALYIRDNPDNKSMKTLSSEFGISVSQVIRIQTRLRWAWLP